ncbi:hypothetical protein ACHAW6_015066 [Cyclotella cf. meneghiniana]
MIKEHNFKPTTHEPCLYSGIWHGEKCYFKQQGDNFEFTATSVTLAHNIPIKRHGLVTLFNGVNVLQTRYYIKLSAETYIQKMGSKYLSMWTVLVTAVALKN